MHRPCTRYIVNSANFRVDQALSYCGTPREIGLWQLVRLAMKDSVDYDRSINQPTFMR